MTPHVLSPNLCMYFLHCMANLVARPRKLARWLRARITQPNSRPAENGARQLQVSSRAICSCEKLVCPVAGAVTERSANFLLLRYDVRRPTRSGPSLTGRTRAMFISSESSAREGEGPHLDQARLFFFAPQSDACRSQPRLKTESSIA